MQLKDKYGESPLNLLYGRSEEVLEHQRQRYSALSAAFRARYPETTGFELFSTPGRTEVGGNHTDHNAGRVLAAAINLDIVAAAAANDEGIIRVHSEDYPPVVVQIDALSPVVKERFTSPALVRGICAGMGDEYVIGGFDAYLASDVPEGSGLSSSAAFEILIATILNQLYNGGQIDDLTLATIAQRAENLYFGKPSGMMDQTACAVGGLLAIDFEDRQNPVVDNIVFDFDAAGYTVMVVETGKSHANLNDEYAAIEREMKSVAQALGGTALREFNRESFLKELPRLHAHLSDRAILRALHFFGDNERVLEQKIALETGDIGGFLSLVSESGRSSWMLCQNLYPAGSIEEQGLSLALAVSESILGDRGACRVHGGGFAGTILAFVPHGLTDRYVAQIEAIFGPGSCHRLAIRPVGSIHLGSTLVD
jgi:galactokinase